MARGNSRAQSEIGATSVVGADVFGSAGKRYWNDGQDRYFQRLADDVALPGLRAENIRLRAEYDKATEEFEAEQKEISRIGLQLHKDALNEAAESVMESAFAKKEYADVLAKTLGMDNAKEWLTSSFRLDEVKPDKTKQALADSYAEQMAVIIAGGIPKGVDAPAINREGEKTKKDMKTEAYYKVEGNRLAEIHAKLGKGPYVPEDKQKITGMERNVSKEAQAGAMSLVLKWRAEGLSADRQRVKLYSELQKSFDKDTGRFGLSPARQAAIFNALGRTIGKGSSDMMRDYVGKLTEGQRMTFKQDLTEAQRSYSLLNK
jgi:hypothetical protein